MLQRRAVFDAEVTAILARCARSRIILLRSTSVRHQRRAHWNWVLQKPIEVDAVHVITTVTPHLSHH